LGYLNIIICGENKKIELMEKISIGDTEAYQIFPHPDENFAK
jgi:hypothetical protein